LCRWRETLKQRDRTTTTSFLHHRRKAGGIVNILHLMADATAPNHLAAFFSQSGMVFAQYCAWYGQNQNLDN
jgi:hypothetical protein